MTVIASRRRVFLRPLGVPRLRQVAIAETADFEALKPRRGSSDLVRSRFGERVRAGRGTIRLSQPVVANYRTNAGGGANSVGPASPRVWQ